MAYFFPQIMRDIQLRLLGDTGTGGLCNATTPMLASATTSIRINDGQENAPLPQIVLNLVSCTTDDAFRTASRRCQIDVHIFVLEQPENGVVGIASIGNIVERVMGNWTAISGGVPTVGLDRFQPALSGTGWEATPMILTNETDASVPGVLHWVQTYSVIISKIGA